MIERIHRIYNSLIVSLIVLLYFFSYYFFVDELGAITYSSILTILIVCLYKPNFDKKLQNILNKKDLLMFVIFFTITFIMVKSKINGGNLRAFLDSILLVLILMCGRRFFWKKN